MESSLTGVLCPPTQLVYVTFELFVFTFSHVSSAPELSTHPGKTSPIQRQIETDEQFGSR